jgi:hypothetical protein
VVASDINPYAAASSMVAMIERMAAHHREIEARGVCQMDLVETLGGSFIRR